MGVNDSQILETPTETGFSLSLSANENAENSEMPDSAEVNERAEMWGKIAVFSGVGLLVGAVAYFAWQVASIPPNI